MEEVFVSILCKVMVCALLHQFIGTNRDVTHYQLIRRYLLHASVVHLDGDEITATSAIHAFIVLLHIEVTTNRVTLCTIFPLDSYVIDVSVLVCHSPHLLLRLLRCLLTELRLPVLRLLCFLLFFRLLHLLGFLCHLRLIGSINTVQYIAFGLIVYLVIAQDGLYHIM